MAANQALPALAEVNILALLSVRKSTAFHVGFWRELLSQVRSQVLLKGGSKWVTVHPQAIHCDFFTFLLMVTVVK